MKSIEDFIVSPLTKRYENEIDVEGIKLITNTNIESYKHVSNLAKVVSTPIVNNTEIKTGDIIVIHHNVFRRFYDIRGNEKNSKSFFQDDLFFCKEDQIYLYKNNDTWKAIGERCFVKPLKNKNKLEVDKILNHIGILKYSNNSLEALGLNEGALISFQPNSEFEFVVDKEFLYCMKSNNIVAHHEYQGHEEEYNPSWTSSC